MKAGLKSDITKKDTFVKVIFWKLKGQDRFENLF